MTRTERYYRRGQTGRETHQPRKTHVTAQEKKHGCGHFNWGPELDGRVASEQIIKAHNGHTISKIAASNEPKIAVVPKNEFDHKQQHYEIA